MKFICLEGHCINPSAIEIARPGKTAKGADTCLISFKNGETIEVNMSTSSLACMLNKY
jgi:competence transcription factor ComK